MKAFDHMIKNGLYRYSADTWGGADRTKNYYSAEGVDGQINYNDEIFVVTHTRGGGAGMGEYPAAVDIIRIKK